MAVLREKEDGIMASINITPLTDVLLVLLIIFMITASAIQKERIAIPTTHYKNQAKESDFVIRLERDGSVYVGPERVEPARLGSTLETLGLNVEPNGAGHPANRIIIKADKDLPYGSVAKAMEAARAAGFNNITLATQPLENGGHTN